jgi:hypothetical protein
LHVLGLLLHVLLLVGSSLMLADIPVSAPVLRAVGVNDGLPDGYCPKDDGQNYGRQCGHNEQPYSSADSPTRLHGSLSQVI